MPSNILLVAVLLALALLFGAMIVAGIVNNPDRQKEEQESSEFNEDEALRTIETRPYGRRW